MPEGDTIFRAARTLHLALAGQAVTRFETALAQLARDDLPGRTVESVSARGKHQLLRLSSPPAGGEPLVLRTHMRMSGSWHLYRPGERWRRPRAAMRIVLETAPWVAVGFDVPVAEFLSERGAARQEELVRLGPDLLAGDFDPAEAARRVAARPDEEIAEVLLDQRVLAGVGNVFKSEILFVAGVSPFRRVASLSAEGVASIVGIARRLLLANAGPASGDGVVTYGGGRRTTRSADPAARLWVYGRGGEPCRRCGAPLAYARQGPHARGTYWCPRCQPA